jgi:hypothetical protein
MSAPRNQHYLPQFYLKGFTDPEVPGRLHVYQRVPGRWASSGPKTVASRLLLHSYEDEEGELHHEIEHGLGQLEQRFAPALERVLAGQELGEEQKADFAAFVLVSSQRVPAVVDVCNDVMSRVGQKVLATIHYRFKDDPDGFEQWKRQIGVSESEDLRDAKVEHLDQSRYHYEIVHDWHHSFVMSVNSALEVSGILLGMNWSFVKSGGADYFITSDRPVAMVDPTSLRPSAGAGLAFPNVEVTMPLSRSVAFIATWTNIQARACAGRGLVKIINQRTAHFAESELIASKRSFPGSDGPLGPFYTPPIADRQETAPT